jgi:hypothetical protein
VGHTAVVDIRGRPIGDRSQWEKLLALELCRIQPEPLAEPQRLARKLSLIHELWRPEDSNE